MKKAIFFGVANLMFAVMLVIVTPSILYFGPNAVHDVWMKEPPEFYASLGSIGTKYQRLAKSLETVNFGALIIVYSSIFFSVSSGILLFRLFSRLKALETNSAREIDVK